MPVPFLLFHLLQEFSHVDFVERAEELVDMTLRTIRGEIRPTKAKFDCRMVEVLPTSQQPTRDFVDKLYKLEHKTGLSTMSLIDKSTYTPGPDPSILSISCIHGFMAADVAEMGSQMVVITDNDMPKAERMAKELGMELFSFRGQTRPNYFTIDAAFDRALDVSTGGTVLSGEGPPPTKRVKRQGGPVVLADVWDNPGGGVAGDATHILRRCIDRGIGGVAFSTVWDPMAVKLCHAAGVGAELQLRFGGKTSPAAVSGHPIDAMVTVLAVEKEATQMWCSAVVPLGDSAAVELPVGGGTIKVCLCSNRTQTFEPTAFSNVGVDPLDCAVLVVKSTNHFFPAFDSIASDVVYVDTGLTHGSPYPSDPTKTNYTKLDRKIWPMVDDPHGVGSEHVPWVRGGQCDTKHKAK